MTLHIEVDDVLAVCVAGVWHPAGGLNEGAAGAWNAPRPPITTTIGGAL